MIRQIVCALVLTSVSYASVASAAPDTGRSQLLALCYHDVVVTREEALRDPSAVTIDDFVKQLAWLRSRGYQPISLAEWRSASRSSGLPDKPVLLTFDDGYASFKTHVLPLLEFFDYPAVLAPVTSWLDNPPDASVETTGEPVSRDRFLSWAQLTEIARSRLVEIASHSHDLHQGVIGNPQGNLQPASVTRIYDRDRGQYESESDYAKRVTDDLALSISLFEQHIGRRPQTVVWPYGDHTVVTDTIAHGLEFETALTLDDAPNVHGSGTIHRMLMGSDMTLLHFSMAVENRYAPTPLRAAHVDLDTIHDPDPAKAERNLGMLLDRVKAMGLSAVFLQAFADRDGDGVAHELYFRNRHLPMRSDLFNRVAWQLRTRANVAVFAWMPVLAFELPDPARNLRLAVKARDGSETQRYHRLSPFHPEVRQIVRELYQDLARSSTFEGVLFPDDAFLTEAEDVNAAALAHYANQWGVGPDSPALAQRKTVMLGEFTELLADELRDYQPDLKTVRNIRARLVIEPDSENRFAQNFTDFLGRYDYTAITATPDLKRGVDADAWLAELVEQVRRHPNALERTLFHLQTVDWRDSQPLPTTVLAGQFEKLLVWGVRHIAYYPDDFATGHPEVTLVRSQLSVNDYPAIAE